ncbi:GTPase Era [Desulfobulbus propionicus]
MKNSIHRSGVAAIIGPPNAGKSTLLNHLLQFKVAIVTPKPQTTRNRIMGIVTGENFQMMLLDTPGLHQAREEMNRQMVRVAMDSLAEADVALFLVDGTDMPSAKLEQRAAEYQGYLDKIATPVVLALNKIDLMDPERLLPVIDWYRALHFFAAIVPISALQGTGVETLVEQLVSHLPEGPRYYPDDLPTDATERFIASEIIREKVFLLTRDEVPYSTAVVIDAFEESDPVVIHASIMVERNSQKGILVGQKGRMLAALRKQATKDIEHLLGCRVRLHLWIKVRKNWTENPMILKDLGLA